MARQVTDAMQGNQLESLDEALNELVNVATILEDNNQPELAQSITNAVDVIEDDRTRWVIGRQSR